MQAPAPRLDSDETMCLLELAGRGDTHAIDQLLADHRPMLRAYVDRYMAPRIRGRVDASDVVQDVQIVIARRLPKFLTRRHMPFDLWILRTARDQLKNVHRYHHAKMRDVDREVVLPDASSVALAKQLVASNPAPSKVVDARERANQVAEIVHELSDSDREILLMHLVDKLPHDEIATLLGVTGVAARQRFVRAMARFARLVEKRGLLGDAP